ncbi:MAG: type II toxin-antitoxin system RelE/ParE family toxin [Elusimicrobia bacterium]|nr:type II toxin-antitoxin system RelE/ParE family toxin [Elusimicrobiota bacterium]
MRIGYYPNWRTGFVHGFLNELKADGQRKKAEAKLRFNLETLEAFWPKIYGTNITVKPLVGYDPLKELVREYAGIAYRIFFCVKDKDIWLLHAIEKKAQKTPRCDLELAYKRMDDVLKGRVRRNEHETE